MPLIKLQLEKINMYCSSLFFLKLWDALAVRNSLLVVQSLAGT